MSETVDICETTTGVLGIFQELRGDVTALRSLFTRQLKCHEYATQSASRSIAEIQRLKKSIHLPDAAGLPHHLTADLREATRSLLLSGGAEHEVVRLQSEVDSLRKSNALSGSEIRVARQAIEDSRRSLSEVEGRLNQQISNIRRERDGLQVELSRVLQQVRELEASVEDLTRKNKVDADNYSQGLRQKDIELRSYRAKYEDSLAQIAQQWASPTGSSTDVWKKRLSQSRLEIERLECLLANKIKEIELLKSR